nr:trypsin-like peptidase domain-containing protein [Methanomicrobium sp. W14]
MLNDKGWIITAAHIFNPRLKHLQDTGSLEAYNSEINKINSDISLNANQKIRKISRIKKDGNWITDFSDVPFIDKNQYAIERIISNSKLDLAVAKLKDFRPQRSPEYPGFKKSGEIFPGKSVCKLGFPFNSIDSEFIQKDDKKFFKFLNNPFPMAIFPMDGIITRNLEFGKTKDGFDNLFIETSSPGLRRQSGGPIFDTNGIVWGIQSRTSHLSLDFSPKIKRNGKEIEENQFINLGIGVHPVTINQFLERNKIEDRIADY